MVRSKDWGTIDYVQMCLTPCLSIISWKISPPVMPTKVWSISCGLYGLSGCTSRHLVSSRLKAGLGSGRSWVAVAAVVLLGLFAASVVVRALAAWAALRYGDTAEAGLVEEKWRALVERRFAAPRLARLSMF